MLQLCLSSCWHDLIILNAVNAVVWDGRPSSTQLAAQHLERNAPWVKSLNPSKGFSHPMYVSYHIVLDGWLYTH